MNRGIWVFNCGTAIERKIVEPLDFRVVAVEENLFFFFFFSSFSFPEPVFVEQRMKNVGNSCVGYCVGILKIRKEIIVSVEILNCL